MKPLIISFFLVILVYSFFIDKEQDKEISPAPVNTQSIYKSEADSMLYDDTATFYASKNFSFFLPETGSIRL